VAAEAGERKASAAQFPALHRKTKPRKDAGYKHGVKGPKLQDCFAAGLKPGP
jgi:hypothetical protein